MTEQNKKPRPRPPSSKFWWVPVIWFDAYKYDFIPYKTGDGFSVWHKMFSRGYLVPKRKGPEDVGEK